MRTKTVLIALFCITLIGNCIVSANFTTVSPSKIEKQILKEKTLLINSGGVPDTHHLTKHNI